MVRNNDEFCVKTEKLCIKNEELCIKTNNCAFKMMNYAVRPAAGGASWCKPEALASDCPIKGSDYGLIMMQTDMLSLCKSVHNVSATTSPS